MKINFNELVRQLAEILRGDAYHRVPDRYGSYDIVSQDAPRRDWHTREQRKYPLHPAVTKALESDHRPTDWHLLTLEWPHVSESDSKRLAYTRDDRAGEADRQVITTVGKYITRHFPSMPDHEVRNLVALYAAGESCKFVHTMAEMIHHLHRGPHSCMVSTREIRCSDGEVRHPYQVYDPQYGWHMAVRIENDDTMGRALCVDNGVHAKYFVRTYAKTGGYSYADEKLHAWLLEQGYEHRNCYMDGTKMAYYPTSDDFLAPFLDGNQQHVDINRDHLRIDGNGEYECDCTSGVPSGGGRIQCDDCGNRFDDGDGYWVGVNEETHVCDSCGNDDYTYAYSRRGHQYYIRNDDTVEINGSWYDTDYLSDNNIVELHDGSYEDMENCVEINGDWYHCDDDDVCRAEDTEEYMLKEDCWMCEESGDWYHDEDMQVEVDGKLYHTDNAPEQTTEEE
jgi:hypothetical protein